jgi:hypothetical protein
LSLKKYFHIFIFFLCFLLQTCTGSRKYFKAAEKLELQGLVKEAAEYYLEALQRKASSVEARIKLKEVGQKYVSSLSSDFFRNFNTQQIEASLETFEKLKEFTSRTKALNLQLDYPLSYQEDYEKAVEIHCSRNYSQAYLLVNQKKYFEALPYISKVEKYNPSYKNTRQLEIIATCEPLYQSAINNLETKNYAAALGLLSNIKVKSDNYKDTKDLFELASEQQSRTFILFEPKPAAGENEKEIQQYLYDNFSESAQRNFTSVKIINNTPFQNAPGTTDLNNSTNLDLIQAIRKATGADYFYVFDILNRREVNSGVAKTPSRGFEEVVTRINDTTVTTEYKPFDYFVVKASRTYSYDYKYKLINAYTNQIVSSQTQSVKATDAVEYNEFARKFTGNINTLFPYNPQKVPVLGRYSPKTWRGSFSARSELRPFDELKAEVLDKTVKLFTSTAGNMK